MGDTPFDIYIAVMNVPETTPLGDLGKAVCMMRNEPIYNSVTTPWGPLQAWQAVILEAQLMDVMARARR